MPREEPHARENEKKERKPTTNNTKLQSPEDSENKTPQPKQLGEKLPTPWYTPWSKQKNSTREGRRRSPPSRRSTVF
jgi:hypothetical protein